MVSFEVGNDVPDAQVGLLDSNGHQDNGMMNNNDMETDHNSSEHRESAEDLHCKTAQRAKEGATRLELLKNELGGFFNTHFFEYSSYTIMALIIQQILGYPYAWPNACSDCYTWDKEDPDLPRICALQESSMEAADTFEFLVTFVLGAFVTSVVSMWRTRRTAYCMVCGATRNLIINVTSVLPDDLEDERKLLARWAVLGYELSVLKARGIIDTDESREYLEALDLLRETEWDSMVNGDRHTTVWWWVQTKAAQLEREGKISDIGFQTLCQAVTLSRDKANDLMSPIDRDQPPPYSMIIAILVNVYLFLNAMASGVQWGVWQFERGADILTYPKYYNSIFVLFTKTFIFAALYDLSVTLYNPFGARSIDIPHRAVSTGIRKLAMDLGDGLTPLSMKRKTDAFKSQISSTGPVREMQKQPTTLFFRRSKGDRIEFA